MFRINKWLAVVLLTLWVGTQSVGAAGAVTFWTQYTEPWVEEVVQGFTRQTGIEVEVRYISYDTDEIFTAIAAGAAPDLFTHGLASLGAIASLDILVPLESHLEKWDFAGGIVPQGLAAGIYKGRQYALPFSGIATRDLIYRADIFEQVGIPAEAPPIHWNDLVEYGKRLVQKTPDGQMVRSGLTVGTNDQMYSMFLNQLGADLFTDDRSLFDQPEALEALEFHVGLVHEHGIDQLGFTNANGVLTGTAAMTWSDASIWMQSLEGSDLLRVATFPYAKQPATFLGTGIMAIPTNAPNMEAALKLAEYLLHPDTQQIINFGTGQVPFYYQAAEWDWVRESPVIGHFMRAVEYGVPNPAHELWFDIRTAMRTAISSALNQQQSPANALAQLHQQVQALLDER